MSNVETILESIEKLTLLEAAELVKAMEEKFGVSAAAPVAVAAPAAAAAPAANKTQIPHVKKVIVVKTRARIERTRPAVARPDFSLLIPTQAKIRPTIESGIPKTAQSGIAKPMKAKMMPTIPKTRPATLKPFPFFSIMNLLY